jgi:UDP-N-acetylmuramate--alanine ligase
MSGFVHFVGVAGAGMRALAELYARRGMRVTGCDTHPETAAELSEFGVTVLEGHSPMHVEGATEVVVTSAMAKDHPELVRARTLGIPVIRRAEALAKAVSGGRLVAIAGTHGKTTTTVLTTSVLDAAGLAPTGLAGGRVGEWNGNLRFGSEQVFVVEADEYDRSFLALTPEVAVVTNVEADHLDVYADLADIKATFAQFVAPASVVVLCADDLNANKLAVPATAEVIRYGVRSPDARLVARNIRLAPLGAGAGGLGKQPLATFDVFLDDKPLGDAAIRVPGAHNILNALAAIGAGLGLGTTLDAMRPGLLSFGGVSRRFEHIADVSGVTIVDDYAHHPTEIAATLEAARGRYPGRRIVVAFQPHLFSRTRDFAKEFAGALSLADVLLVCDIYPAREEPIPGVTSDVICSEISAAGKSVAWAGPRSALAPALHALAREGDVVLTMGAGDVTGAAPELRDLLAGGAR